MSTVYKQVLRPMALQDIELPRGAEILHVALQRGGYCLWFRCNPDEPKEPRRVAIVGTGQGCPSADSGRYIGTVLTPSGEIVFHFFEMK